MATHHNVVDPAFACVVKTSPAFIIWRVEVSSFLSFLAVAFYFIWPFHMVIILIVFFFFRILNSLKYQRIRMANFTPETLT